MSASGGRRMAGLKGPVEILRDQWGIPHVRAGNPADAFFGQGFATAEDRFWHMDRDRRMAYGTLAELVGRIEDRRVILLEILPKGKKIIVEIQGQSLALLLKAYDRFNATEHDAISRFYATVSKVMDDFLLRFKNED